MSRRAITRENSLRRTRCHTTIRPSLAKYIAKKHPEFNADAWIGHHALNEFRTECVEDVLDEELESE